MKTTGRLTLTTALLGLALAVAGSARAADELEIVSFTPAPPAGLAGLAGGPMGPGNSVEVAFAYKLETAPNGRIGFYTAAVPGNPVHTGVEQPFMVAAKGKGRGTTRFSVKCDGTFEVCHIVKVRYCLFHDTPGGPVKLVEKFKDVDFKFKCPPSTQPGTHPTRTYTPTHPPSTQPGGGPPTGANKPNITSARPGLYIWGSDPTKKHWVPWNTAVNLTAAESINPHPVPSNGRCAFNVQYYEKETNGVATGPFRNKIYSDADERAINGPWSLAASQVTSRTTQPYLDAGGHGLKLVLDADGSVAETNEGDNAFSIRYYLKGTCDAPKTGATTAPKK